MAEQLHIDADIVGSWPLEKVTDWATYFNLKYEKEKGAIGQVTGRAGERSSVNDHAIVFK